MHAAAVKTRQNEAGTYHALYDSTIFYTSQQGSDTRVRTQKNPVGLFGYTHLQKPHPKNPHFYFSLIVVYTLYATNNAIFYCFKATKALSY